MYLETGESNPLNPKNVTLYLSRPNDGIEAMEIDVKSSSDGAWETDSIVLPQAGEWHFRLDLLIDDFNKVILEDEITIRD